MDDLSPAKIEELQQLCSQEKDAEQRDRLRCILMAGQGFVPSEIAPKLGRSVRFVQKWLAIHREGGLQVVCDRPSPGAKSRLEKDVQDDFCDSVMAVLRARGRIRGHEVVRLLEEKFGRTYSLPGAYELMNRLGLPRRLPVAAGAAGPVPATRPPSFALPADPRDHAALEAMLAAVSEGVLVEDPDGRPVAWNPRFAELWRLPEDALASHDRTKLLAAMLGGVREPARFLERVRSVQEDRGASTFEALAMADGRVFGWSSRPWRVGQGIAGRIWTIADATATARLEDELRAKDARHGRVADAMDGLHRLLDSPEPCESAHLFAAAAAALSRTLGVSRAGIWLLSDEDTRLACLAVHDASGVQDGGISWLASGCPHYFAAVARKRELAVHDVRTHPATREMAAGYFEPLGVVSMLDVPIHSAGRVAGVVRLEHVGVAGRHFNGDDRMMAHLVAALVARHLGEAALRAEEMAFAAAHRVPVAPVRGARAGGR